MSNGRNDNRDNSSRKRLAANTFKTETLEAWKTPKKRHKLGICRPGFGGKTADRKMGEGRKPGIINRDEWEPDELQSSKRREDAGKCDGGV